MAMSHHEIFPNGTYKHPSIILYNAQNGCTAMTFIRELMFQTLAFCNVLTKD